MGHTTRKTWERTIRFYAKTVNKSMLNEHDIRTGSELNRQDAKYAKTSSADYTDYADRRQS
jgi:hypothetical protein